MQKVFDVKSLGETSCKKVKRPREKNVPRVHFIFRLRKNKSSVLPINAGSCARAREVIIFRLAMNN